MASFSFHVPVGPISFAHQILITITHFLSNGIYINLNNSFQNITVPKVNERHHLIIRPTETEPFPTQLCKIRKNQKYIWAIRIQKHIHIHKKVVPRYIINIIIIIIIMNIWTQMHFYVFNSFRKLNDYVN